MVQVCCVLPSIHMVHYMTHYRVYQVYEATIAISVVFILLVEELVQSFQLYAICSHLGDTPLCGHYVADCRWGNKWYRFSDETYDNKHPVWISVLVVVILVSPLYLLPMSMPAEMAI